MLASSVRITQDVKQPFLSSGQMLKALVIAAGMAVLYDLLFRVLAYGLEGRLDWAAAGVRRLRLTQVYREHTLLFCAAALLLMWAGHLACMYPAATNSDTASQIRMVLGLTRFNENHPLLNTAYIGIFLWIGRLLGNANAGLFLCVLSQTCFAAAVIGYSQWLMRRLGAPRWLRAGALLVCGLMPVYVYNISAILKDIPYTYAALLLLCEVVRGMFLEEEGYAKSAGFALRWFLAAMLLLTMRNNGMGILAPVTLAWGIRAIRRRDGRLVLRLAALLLIPMLLVSGLKSVYRQGKDTRTVEVDGALSLMLQQTGRFVREHGDEIPPEEREVLEAVFEYDRISGWYDPIISDPMKLAFRNDAQPEEIRQYLRVWARQFLRDPLCYVKATFIQNALLFDPQTYNLAIFSSLGGPAGGCHTGAGHRGIGTAKARAAAGKVSPLHADDAAAGGAAQCGGLLQHPPAGRVADRPAQKGARHAAGDAAGAGDDGDGGAGLHDGQSGPLWFPDCLHDAAGARVPFLRAEKGAGRTGEAARIRRSGAGSCIAQFASEFIEYR